ncbi:rhomboid-domain-containing protein [Dacryopinax primogenitus]|uniref:Rhomboid-type serine protease n=1 Tax=Dacryopinax primogenitus (strain DJM 731) TaxID=1858805 RepID=M5G5M7_DACPD|nr:rhomboid-domain-containing protein [Dacryopinax primogenitus]EJU01107.1 rhomboid-domain-containing protein [Dacryopinax primogenitus]
MRGDELRYPLEQRIENRRRGVTRQRWSIVVPILTVAMISVFIYELVLNAHFQGTPVSFHPTVNYMLGPGGSTLINVGARFVPCMKLVPEVPPTTQLACMNDTANPADQICPLSTVCGFGGFPADGVPNQWFRFILPIFLHVGIIHILLNMLAQATLCTLVERQVGSTAFIIIYFAAGIFGNVLGGNFALLGITSMGASGAIFGCVAAQWVDLLTHWNLEDRPGRSLIFLIIEFIIGFGLGYIPGVDNFAHLGGFLMGLLTCIVLFPVISVTRTHMIVVWVCRILAIPLIIVLFVVLIRNFYTTDPAAGCEWCRYLSCIPTSANNYCQGTGLTTGNTAF